jgi:hypothetical protein
MRTFSLLLTAAVALPGLACGDRRAVPPPAEAPPAAPTVAAAPAPEPAPPAWLEVGYTNLRFDALGDTVRLLAEGAACTSADAGVATVGADGLVRSVGNGRTRVRCEAGGAVASVRVEVKQLPVRARIVARDGLTLERQGDSTFLSLAAVDRIGTPLRVGVPTKWSSLAPAVVKVDSISGLAVSQADSGSARIVALADGLSDTVTVDIGPKQLAALNLNVTTRPGRFVSRASLARSAARRPQPARSPGAAAAARLDPNTIGARPITPADSLQPLNQDSVLAARKWVIEPQAVLVLAEHRVDPGTGVEATDGLMYGLGLEVTRGWLSVGAQLATGALGSSEPGIRDRTTTDLAMDVGVVAFPWLTLAASGGLRVYEQDAQENWRFIGVTGDLHFPLGTDALTGQLRLTLLPLVSRATSVAGAAEPDFGLRGAAGLHFQRRKLSADILYFMERYVFPSSGGVTRLEQFSGLRFRIGLALGL